MWVGEQLLHKEKALDKLVQELKTKKCDVPVEPTKDCKGKCEQAEARAKQQSQLVKSKGEVVKKACENKLRKLQAPAPAAPAKPETQDAKDTAKEAEKPDPKVDDCTKAKKNLAGEKLV